MRWIVVAGVLSAMVFAAAPASAKDATAARFENVHDQALLTARVECFARGEDQVSVSLSTPSVVGTAASINYGLESIVQKTTAGSCDQVLGELSIPTGLCVASVTNFGESFSQADLVCSGRTNRVIRAFGAFAKSLLALP